MGQQQLLLLLIAIVVTLISVLAGFSIYDQQRKKSEADGVLNRAMMVAQAAIEWRTRDKMFGGGGGDSYAPLQGQGIEALGLDPSAVRTEIVIGGSDIETIDVIGVSSTDPEIGARVVVNGAYIEFSDVKSDSSIVLP